MYREGSLTPLQETPPTPLSALWIALGGATLVSGLVLTLVAWRPTSLLSLDAYSATITLHGGLGVCALAAWLVLLYGAVRAERPGPPYPLIAWVIASLTALGVLCVWASPGVPGGLHFALPPALRIGQLVLFVVGGSVAAHAVKSLSAVHPWERWLPLAVAGVAMSAVALTLAPAFAGLAPEATRVCMEALLVATVTALIDVGAYRTGRVSVLPLLMLALSARAMLAPGQDAELWLTRVRLFAGIVFAIAAFRALPRTGPTSVRWLGALTAMCFLEAVLLRCLTEGVGADIRFSDTFVSTAAWHAEVFTGVVALLVLYARRANAPSEAVRGAGFPLGAMALGLQGTIGAWALLGGRGQPMRYVSYLSRFTALHRVAAVASLVLALGVTGWLMAFRTRAPQG